MPEYKKVTSVNLIAGQSPETAEAIALLNELASLRYETVTRSLITFLREALPSKIHEIRNQRNQKIA